jgi:Flp pilus assembly protein TadD
VPKSAMLHHSLGLALVRQKQTQDALAELEQATILDPANARFSFCHSARGQAELELKQAESHLRLVMGHDSRADSQRSARRLP